MLLVPSNPQISPQCSDATVDVEADGTNYGPCTAPAETLYNDVGVTRVPEHGLPHLLIVHHLICR
jgi:hypothetical protein